MTHAVPSMAPSRIARPARRQRVSDRVLDNGLDVVVDDALDPPVVGDVQVIDIGITGPPGGGGG